MKLFLVEKIRSKKLVTGKRVFVFFSFVVFAAFVYLFFSDHKDIYCIDDQSEMITSNTDLETLRYALSKGHYEIHLNAVVPLQTPVVVYIDSEHQLQTSLEVNEAGGDYTIIFDLDETTSLFHLIFLNGAVSGLQINQYDITSEDAFSNDQVFFMFLCMLAAIGAYFIFSSRCYHNMDMHKKLYIFVTIGIAVFVSYPMFKNYLG
ncbi:MAG TPA: hypothetical protein PLU43_11805, partial [Lachnospiraceae bacterium]|nr:hypothetical protein [Lachnospiraceae bacterium]